MQDRAASDVLRAFDESLIDVLYDHGHKTLDGFSEAIILGSDRLQGQQAFGSLQSYLVHVSVLGVGVG